jgi:RimJ/RimL family protein N-acetyltransferase
MSPTLYPGPAYRIQTQRLVIRCWDPEDAPLLKSAIEDNIDHLLPWMPWAANEPQPLQQKIDLIRGWRGEFDLGRSFVYGVFDLQEHRVLGGTGLHTRIGEGAREIGYWIHKDFTRQGLATEVTAALTNIAFEVDGVGRVEIHCDPENIASASVPRKLGFVHEATLHKRLPFGNDFKDLMIWTLFAENYIHSPCAHANLQAFDALGRKILPELNG